MANPDFGATFGQAVTINNQPVIPLNDTDTPPNLTVPVPPMTAQQSRMQAIANAASFHFAMIEQGGSSLYTTLSLQVTNLDVLRIVVSIGGTEVDHFGVWQDVGPTPSSLRWQGSPTPRREHPSPTSTPAAVTPPGRTTSSPSRASSSTRACPTARSSAPPCQRTAER